MNVGLQEKERVFHFVLRKIRTCQDLFHLLFQFLVSFSLSFSFFALVFMSFFYRFSFFARLKDVVSMIVLWSLGVFRFSPPSFGRMERGDLKPRHSRSFLTKTSKLPWSLFHDAFPVLYRQPPSSLKGHRSFQSRALRLHKTLFGRSVRRSFGYSCRFSCLWCPQPYLSA